MKGPSPQTWSVTLTLPPNKAGEAHSLYLPVTKTLGWRGVVLVGDDLLLAEEMENMRVVAEAAAAAFL